MQTIEDNRIYSSNNLDAVRTIFEALRPEDLVTPYGEIEQHPYYRKNGFEKRSDGSFVGGKGFNAKTITHENKNGVHNVKVFRNSQRPELIGEGQSSHSAGMALTKALNQSTR